MSKRRALSSSKVELEPEAVPLTPSPPPTLPDGSSGSGKNTIKFSEDQLAVLKHAIVEVGGPFWDRILEFHGSTGTHSQAFAGLKPYHLWRATSEIYCDLLDSGSMTDALPLWAQLASKAASTNASSFGIREKEVIQAAFDAYGWSESEDNAILDILQHVKAPLWRTIHEELIKRIPESYRSQEDVENRAIVLHRYHAYFHPLNIPQGLEYLRTTQVSSFGLPWNADWSEDQDAKLLDGINKTRGPYWGKILGLYGTSGIHGNQLASKSETDLASRAREWWIAASGPGRDNIDRSVLDVLQYIQPKGFTISGMPTSRGWSDEQDWILISELNLLKSPNYNEILMRHGVNGRVSDKLAPKNYAQLRGRALKLHDFCIREKRPMPEGLQYAKRKD